MAESLAQRPHRPFYVVGIGASAGGLNAIERFLQHIPSNSGLAYVIVQHLDPVRESGLVDLIQHWTDMSVRQIEDGMLAEQDTVYVIPPNYILGIMHRTLQLMSPDEPHFRWQPINYFFRALADDRGKYAIGVVLSGAGSDGALGLQAIKGGGGLTLAQRTDTASHTSMPSSAINTGHVDFILPPEDMAEEIMAYADHALILQQEDTPLPTQADYAWQKVFFLLRSNTGHDFSEYKQSTIRRRVERRLLVNRIDNLEDYVRYMQYHPDEVHLLFSDLLIGVTQFFRDPTAFQALTEAVIGPLVERSPRDQSLRVWVNGCSTGEEAYSIAILIYEQMEVLNRSLTVQIFATDIDGEAIARARRVRYDKGIVGDVAPERLARFFQEEDGEYAIKPFIRDMLVFAPHNTVQDPPFSNVDLISCRNLLIYLGSELQARLLPVLHYALSLQGYLFLGNSEALGQFARLFKTIDMEAKIFQRRELPSNTKPTFDVHATLISRQDEPVIRQKRTDMNKPLRLRQLAEMTLLEDYTPPAVIVNGEGDILYFHERTGRYLEPAVGEAKLNLLRLAREGLRLLLSNMVRKAAREHTEIHERNVQVQFDDHLEVVDLTVKPLAHAEADGLMLVVFERVALLPEPGGDWDDSNGDLAADRVSQQRVIDLERDIQNMREHLQATVENLETSNEELKSTNEELQSANEELQSTNEELTSAKEELQSVNEELMTVNSELENKIDELSRANDDLRNLLTSVEIGIVFLDRELRVARFNSAAAEYLNLQSEDIERPIAHLVPRLDYHTLAEDAQIVLERLESKELEVRMGPNWYLLHIRPYRTINNIIDGVIITIADITEQKQVQQNLRKLSRAIDQSPSLAVIIDVLGSIEYANQRFYEVMGYAPEAIAGQPFSDLVADKTEMPDLHAIGNSRAQWSGQLALRTANNDICWLEISISPLTNDYGVVTHLIVVGEDVTRRKQLEQTLYTRWEKRYTEGDRLPIVVLVFDRNLQYILGETDALTGIGLSGLHLEGDLSVEVLSSDLERYYRAALRGDNIYFERLSGDLRFGIQVMPVRDAAGSIFAGVVVVWDIGRADDGT